MTALEIMTKACDEAKIPYRIEKRHSISGTTYQTLEFIESFDAEMWEMRLHFLNGKYVPDKDFINKICKSSDKADKVFLTALLKDTM